MNLNTPEDILAALKLCTYHTKRVNTHLDALLLECAVEPSFYGTVGPDGIISDYELRSVNLVSKP